MTGPTRAGIELHEQQPCFAARYRQAGRQILSRSELGEPRGTQPRVQRGEGRPGGQPEAASCGGKLPGQQPRIAARDRQAGRQILGRSELGKPRGTQPRIPAR